MRLLVFLAGFAFGLGTTLPAVAQNIFTSDVLMCSGRPWVDVRCNGAIGDGSHDDTAAINTTVAAAITGNFPVHFPAGIYRVTSKLTWDYQGIAGNGLEVISRGAIIDGRTIAAGNVLQIQCSGGTTGAPATCNHLLIENDLYILGNTPAYVVALGKADLSDIHNAAKIDHLVVTNASANTAAGAIQANYLTDGYLSLTGTTAGGNTSTAAIAFEQVQTSRISGAATSTASAGANAAALLLENGATASNTFAGFTYSSNTCLSITSAMAINNTFIAPTFPCPIWVNGTTSANNNVMIGPTFTGATPGPLSGAIGMIGRGALGRYSEPTSAALSVYGVDDGLIVSAKNAIGSVVNWDGSHSSAASLPVTLPTPSQVGAGWTMGFVTDANKAVVLTPPGAAKILAGNIQLGTLTLGPGNFEVAVVKSDGANFRLMYVTTNTRQLNGIDSAQFPVRWEFPGGPGYAATQGDNGNMLSSALTSGGLTLTLPSTTAIQPGWTVGAVADGKPVTVVINGTAGGHIKNAFGTHLNSYSITQTRGSEYGIANFQFDGAAFRIIGAPTHRLPEVVEFGAACDSNGTSGNGTDDTAGFAAADAAGLGFRVTGKCRIASNLTLNSQVTFGPTGAVVVDAGKTVTYGTGVFSYNGSTFGIGAGTSAIGAYATEYLPTVPSSPSVTSQMVLDSCPEHLTADAAADVYCRSVIHTVAGGSTGNARGSLNVLNDMTGADSTPHGAYYFGAALTSRAIVGNNGVGTTLTSTVTAGATSLPVSSISGFVNGDFLEVMLDGTPQIPFPTVISATPSGSTLAINPGIPANNKATSGNAVYVGRGTYNGAILQAVAKPNARYEFAAIGASAATYVEAGASVLNKFALSLERDTPDAAKGLIWDAMESQSGQFGAQTANYGFLIGDHLGLFPIDGNGTLMKVGGTSTTLYALSNVFDLSRINVTGTFATWISNFANDTFGFTGPGAGVLSSMTLQTSIGLPVINFIAKNANQTNGGLSRLVLDQNGHTFWQANTGPGQFTTTVRNAWSIWDPSSLSNFGYPTSFDSVMIGSPGLAPGNLPLGGLGFLKLGIGPPNAVGAGTVVLVALAGTNGGTCKIVAYAGTSTAPTTLLDNIGAGC